jgi:hypothetical protein
VVVVVVVGVGVAGLPPREAVGADCRRASRSLGTS